MQPPISGLTEAGFLTNETVFNLTERPPRLAIIGGGPIGCELAQAFQRLGCQVVPFHKMRICWDREDMDAASIVRGVHPGSGTATQREDHCVERNGGEKCVV